MHLIDTNNFCRCEKLVSQNNLLRDQLEESHQLNEALTNDLQKLTNDWEALRDEMSIKEDEWKDEEQVSRLKCGSTFLGMSWMLTTQIACYKLFRGILGIKCAPGIFSFSQLNCRCKNIVVPILL